MIEYWTLHSLYGEFGEFYLNNNSFNPINYPRTRVILTKGTYSKKCLSKKIGCMKRTIFSAKMMTLCASGKKYQFDSGTMIFSEDRGVKP